jgi:cytoskeletal protein CcmA (bactofilin family)
MKLDMKIFGNEEEMNGQKGDGRIETIIGKGTNIDGTVTIEGATRIDGNLTGKLTSNDIVTVGATGLVKAEIRAKAVIIGGRVEGNIFASEKVELQTKCELLGDITSKSLLIEHGAVFHGNSKMKDVGGASAAASSNVTGGAPKQEPPKPTQPR